MTTHHPLAAADYTEDEAIYLSENRYGRPKELFKQAAALIETLGAPDGGSLVDVGCATGEFLFYLRGRFPALGAFAGLDISPKMLDQAAAALEGVDFAQYSLLSGQPFGRRFDIVTCLGVFHLFDDIRDPLRAVLGLVKPGGVAVIYAPFNDDPIDVVSRHRRSQAGEAPWEIGWNIVSKATVERELEQTGLALDVSWNRFRLPFAIERAPGDPMRTWTVAMGDNPFQTVNGACQIIDGQFLAVRVLA